MLKAKYMRRKKYNISLYVLVFWMGYTLPAFTQIKSNPQQQEQIYRDRITDEYGKPLTGIKVSVRGNANYTYTDANGEFSIKAHIGDEIILSKNGQLINTYFYDSGLHYELEDIHSVLTESETKNEKKSTYKRSVNYLDSAKAFLNSEPFKSIDFVEEELRSRKKHPKASLITAYTILGKAYAKLKQYDLAISNFKKAVDEGSDTEVVLLLAESYAKDRQYKKSNALLYKLKENSLPALQEVKLYRLLSIGEQGLGRNEPALSFAKKALQIANKNNFKQQATEIQSDIAKKLSEKGKLNEADRYIQNTLETADEGVLVERTRAQNQAANIYQSNKNYDKEIAIRKQTLDELKEAQVEEIIIEDEEGTEKLSASKLNLDIGNAYAEKKDYKKAIPYLEESVEKAKVSNEQEIAKDALQKLSELYKQIGNSKKALQKYQEYALAVDELYRQKENEIAKTIALNNELREKQNRINSLEKDRQLSENQYLLSAQEKELTTLNYQRQKIIIYALILGMLLLGLTLLFMYRSNRKSKLANNLLALKSLRTQMNPHFIFNALNSVNSFIAENNERKANKYLTDFSGLMRQVLENSEKDLIPLSEEIDMLKTYVQLEHARFKDKFDYQINIAPQVDLETYAIPPMLIQPYVENAVWHGLRYKKEKGNLTIDMANYKDNQLAISITDDGIGRKRSQEIKTDNQRKRASKAMKNTKGRIAILNEMYGNSIQINVTDLHDDHTGTKVNILLKKY